MSKKYYFPDFDEETAYTKEYIVDEMKRSGLTECDVSIAIKDTDKYYFFCRAFGEAGTNGLSKEESCGRECCRYEPRNGRSGCCRHKVYCLTPGDDFKLSIDGKLTKIKKNE
jgi:hypothetical protein